jgi:hypothetical protein
MSSLSLSHTPHCSTPQFVQELRTEYTRAITSTAARVSRVLRDHPSTSLKAALSQNMAEASSPYPQQVRRRRSGFTELPLFIPLHVASRAPP